MAAGEVHELNPRRFTLRAERGNPVNGICSNPFLEEAFLTTSWEITYEFHDDGTFSYEQVTKLVIPGVEGEFEHTDTNRLRLIQPARPNPAMIQFGLIGHAVQED